MSYCIVAILRPGQNRFDLPLTILQTGIVNITWPDYMSFGGVATIIGHEITHGFDTNGRQFDEDGSSSLITILKNYH